MSLLKLHSAFVAIIGYYNSKLKEYVMNLKSRKLVGVIVLFITACVYLYTGTLSSTE